MLIYNPEKMNRRDFVGQMTMNAGLLMCGRSTSEHLNHRKDATQTKLAMQSLMGDFPPRKDRSHGSYEVLSRKSESAYNIFAITYQSMFNETVRANLLVPRNANGVGVLVLHQTTDLTIDEPAGSLGNPDLHYGSELAAIGYTVIAPEYPTLGKHSIELPSSRWKSGCMKAICDNNIAINILLKEPSVKHQSVGCIGHSLGGHNGLFTSVFDHRIRCLATSCGFTSFERYYGGNLKGWSSNRYMPLIAKNNLTPKDMPFDFCDIFASMPSTAIFVSAPINDSNFDITGVKETLSCATRRTPGQTIHSVFPDCGHEFPKSSRDAAYDFFRMHLHN